MIETPLLEICDIHARIGWQGLRSDEFLSNGPYYLVTGTDIKDGFIDWDNAYFINRERYCQDTHIQLRIGDILVTKDGTIGKVGYINYLPKEATLNSGVYVIRPKKEKLIDPNFLSWFFKSLYFDSFIQELKAGSTISHLYQKDFVKLTVQYPENIEEQKRIAGALSDIDSLIREIEVLIEKKRSILQGTMQELLSACRRLPGFSEPFISKKLKEIVLMNSGGTPSTDNKDYYNGNIPFLSISDITASSKYLYNTNKHISQSAIEETSVRLYKKGTLLLSMYASIGKVCITKIDVAISQAILGFIFIDKNVVPEYIYYLLCYSQKELAESGQTGTQSNLNKRIVQNFNISIPSQREEQEAIASILSDMDSEISELEVKRNKYIAIRQGMMQQLLTGKIRLI